MFCKNDMPRYTLKDSFSIFARKCDTDVEFVVRIFAFLVVKYVFTCR